MTCLKHLRDEAQVAATDSDRLLQNSGSLEYQLRSLGLRHVTYKVHPHHISLMVNGCQILWALWALWALRALRALRAPDMVLLLCLAHGIVLTLQSPGPSSDVGAGRAARW
jgi:hypothetical protein